MSILWASFVDGTKPRASPTSNVLFALVDLRAVAILLRLVKMPNFFLNSKIWCFPLAITYKFEVFRRNPCTVFVYCELPFNGSKALFVFVVLYYFEIVIFLNNVIIVT